MRTFAFLILFLICNCACALQLQTNVETIVMFRHGEKPALDFGQLNCKGLNRAIALPKVLEQKFGTPNYIFAPYPYWKGFYYYVRAIVSIAPMAIKLDMPISTNFYYHDIDNVANMLLDNKYHNSLLFVTWEHKNIVRISKKLMQLLKANENLIPAWDSKDFDSIYVFTVNWNTDPATVSFVHDHQNLNNGSEQCPIINNIKNYKKNADKKFIFVPAAEPAKNSFDQLSCVGFNRALMLPQVFNRIAPDIQLFVLPAPDEITVKPEFKRALLTLEPTIINRGGIYIPAGYKDAELFAKKMKKAVKGTIVVAWPLHDMANVVRELYQQYGGNPQDIPSPVPNRDTIYQVTIGKGNKPVFAQLQENISTPAAICPE